MVELSLEELMERSGNIYEAVVIMSKRARQINDEQKLQIESEMEIAQVSENKDNEDFDDVEIDREALMREYKKYPKPSTKAIEEMTKNGIKYRYDISSEEEGEN